MDKGRGKDETSFSNRRNRAERIRLDSEFESGPLASCRSSGIENSLIFLDNDLIGDSVGRLCQRRCGYRMRIGKLLLRDCNWTRRSVRGIARSVAVVVARTNYRARWHPILTVN